MHRKVQVVLVGLAIAVAWPALGADSPAELLENGMYTEQTVGDLDAAIVIYRKVLALPAASEAQKAQAQFRLGMCYMKKRSPKEAEQAFQAVVEKYGDQKELVAQARTRLMRLSAPNPAALMPPDTLVYLEVGSPGQQVQTIVNMLKGTPLANPLEMISGQRPGQAPAGAAAQGPKTPGDMISALLNPSMMEEFKKVRGLAVGLLDVSGRQAPPSVTVLYPGESDALRGLIVAGLLMAGQQGQVLEDMQTVVMQGVGAMVAYDDNVFIAVTAEDGQKAWAQLTWCIRQYKGLGKEPTLATRNEAFARMTSPQDRQRHALTLWANPSGVFERLEKQFASGGRIPSEVRLARDLGDIKNIDGLVARLVIDEKAPYLEACVSFQKDHQCLPYDLIRTPPLSPGGFQAVPADAVALVSIALSGAADAQQARAQQALQRLTGLDIGREVFANIEQVNLFLVPHEMDESDAQVAKAFHPVAPLLGLSLTSHDPAKTHQLLDRLLSLPGRVQGPEEENVPGRYLISSHSRMEIVRDPNGRQISRKVVQEGFYCYMAQVGRSTVLSLSPKVVEAAQAAPGPAPAGGIRARLAELPAGACKLALADAGGLVRLWAVMEKAHRSPTSLTRPATAAKFEALSKLADVLSMTSLELHTVEKPTALTVRVGLRDLPPLSEVFPLIMQAMR